MSKPIIDRMAASLAPSEVDLSDERDVVRWLMEKFTYSGIIAYGGKAAAKATEIRKKRHTA